MRVTLGKISPWRLTVELTHRDMKQEVNCLNSLIHRLVCSSVLCCESSLCVCVRFSWTDTSINMSPLGCSSRGLVLVQISPGWVRYRLWHGHFPIPAAPYPTVCVDPPLYHARQIWRQFQPGTQMQLIFKIWQFWFLWFCFVPKQNQVWPPWARDGPSYIQLWVVVASF